jgi:hypothetical protein
VAELCVPENELKQWATGAEMLQQKTKVGLQEGLSPGLQRDRPAPKPLSHEDLLIPSASFFHFTELAACCEQ